MRTINKELLKRLIHSEKNGRTNAAKAAKCSPHTVSNWLRPRYVWGIQEYHAKSVAKHFEVEVDELFPPGDTGEEQAS